MIIPTPEDVRAAADTPQYYKRGVRYFEQGRVDHLEPGGDGVYAVVTGQDAYQVRLWWEDGRLAGECDCPVGADGWFCKHCVAAGLAWAEAGRFFEEGQPAGGPPVPPGPAEVAAAVAALGPERLAEVVAEEARRNSAFAALLVARAGLLPAPEPGQIERVRAALARAARGETWHPWRLRDRFARALGELRLLVHSCAGPQVVALVDEFAAVWEEACEELLYDEEDPTSERIAGEIAAELEALRAEAERLAGG
ncbi:SWIM zinc finger family protein [Carbonactinospora thermoautotrophica]|uniref:SWIM zinc finger family protein n=1 Tax=Carbonactinospora thermoautotrophica TaxID=1469144 RepID=UPI00082B78EA|nr:hypothetical protein [Carbonactinospora thermoautotrophica]